MKRKFTKLMAALALLTFLIPPMVGWGQTRTETTVTWTASNANDFGGTISQQNGTKTGTISTGSYSWDYVNTLTYLKSNKSDYAQYSGTTGFLQIGSSNAYHSLVLTTSAIPGTITSISVECSSASGAHTLTATVGSTSYINQSTPSGQPNTTDNYVVTGIGSSSGNISISLMPGSGALYIKSISVTYEEGGTPSPSITADNIEIDYDDEEGGIVYEIENYVAGTMVATTTADWITDFTYEQEDEVGEVDFTTTINPNGTERSATVTLTYDYGGDQPATKDVTVTQVGNPNIVSTIAEVRAQSTGSTVVTKGVVTTIVGNTAYIQDANAAICVFGNSDYPVTANVGDEIRVTGTLSDYHNLLEITNPTYTVLSTGNTVTPEVMTIANILTSTNQGWFIKIEDATVTNISGSGNSQNTTIAQGDNTIVARGNLGTVAVNDVINLTGNISVYSDTKQIANPIVIPDPAITVDEETLSFTYQVGATEAPQETLVVEGSYLEGNVTVAISGNGFKMTGDGGITWTTENIILTPTNGTLEETMIGVQMITGLGLGEYEGTITLTSTNAQSVTVSLSGTVTNQTYPITLNQPTAGGTISSSPAGAAEAGVLVTLSYELATGYAFGEWTVLKDDLTEVEVNNNQFTMPNCEVMVSGSFSQVNYTITVANVVNGQVEASDETAHYGDDIIVTVTPNEGYRVKTFTVTETNGTGTVTDIEVADDIYSFDMPAFNITIAVEFEQYYNGGTFILHTGAITDGYYVITYNGYVMKNVISSSRFANGEYPTITDNTISDTDGDLKDIVWHFQSNAVGQNTYWTIYNDDVKKYAAGTNSKNQGALIDDITDLARWTITVSNGTFQFENLGRSNASSDSGNKWLRNNGTSGWATYASSTGGALTLYRLVDVEERTITFNGNGGTLPTSGDEAYTQTVYDGIAVNLTANQFTKESAIFLGWATSADGEVEYADEAEVTLSADLTLYAKWQQTYTLTLSSPGASVFVFVGEDYFELEDGDEAQIPEEATVEVSIDLHNCQEFAGITVTYGGETIEPTDLAPEDPENLYYSFTMPAAAATLAVTTTQKTLYTLTVNELSGATLEILAGNSSTPIESGAQLCEGLYVSVTATIEAGYAFESLTVTYGDNQEVEVTTQGTNTFSFEMPAADATLTFTTRAAATYALVTDASQIVSGKHYIIASGTEGTVKVMGNQRDSNRGSVAVTVNNSSITETTGIYELVINGPDANGKYTIYDAQYPGYLYAASSNSNHLKTRTNNSDANSQWTIEIAATSSIATIKAQGNNTRNWMRNNGSLFSCYSSGQSDIYLYLKDSDNDLEYYGTEIAYSGTSITEGTITVGAGSIMTVSSGFTNDDPEALIIGEGGQLVTPNPVAATVQMDIVGYNPSAKSENGGWYFISSPLSTETTSVANNTNLITTDCDYDLYRFDESFEGEEWRNFKADNNLTAFNAGEGYLYANEEGLPIAFSGQMRASKVDDEWVTFNKSIAYTEGKLFAGWNLVGNPFPCNAKVSLAYYKMNSTSEGLNAVANSADGVIAPMEGVFVNATGANQEVVFTATTDAVTPRATSSKGAINIDVENNGELLDRAIVTVNRGGLLGKLNLNKTATKLYIPQNGNDYAIVVSSAQGEMPVNFKASKNGSYTINVNAENTEMNYLHLIDNMTGADIDLLAEPSYTFSAKTSDYASRFRLVFSANDENASTSSETFAYFNGSDWSVSNMGEATLQVVDMLGRIVKSETINGNATMSTNNLVAGVYVMRLINGENVMTQKIVVR
jgi:hypothetical protein